MLLIINGYCPTQNLDFLLHNVYQKHRNLFQYCSTLKYEYFNDGDLFSIFNHEKTFNDKKFIFEEKDLLINEMIELCENQNIVLQTFNQSILSILPIEIIENNVFIHQNDRLEIFRPSINNH